MAKLAVVAVLGLGLAGCAGPDLTDYDQAPMPREHAMVENDGHAPLQCVPYAREHSGIKIYGDAYTWWDKAAGKYPRGSLPEPGAVLVLNNYAGSNRGHVAVVRRVIGPREIRIDHANWLDDGSIYVNNPVEDVSSGNDWSLVRVYNLKTGGWGAKIYPVQGFIGGGGTPSDLVADSGGAQMGATALVGEIN
ncbi:MAG: CHAP domain-containing protein [Alphaproteobacteria bacterium]|nr:CHAP domain-containing protein [Alphaproteobacteria bacterium]